VYGDHDVQGDRTASGTFTGRAAHGEWEDITVTTYANRAAYDAGQARNGPGDDYHAIIRLPGGLADVLVLAYEDSGPHYPVSPAKVAAALGGTLANPGPAGGSPQAAAPAKPVQPAAPAAPAPAPHFTSASAVVVQFYQDLHSHHYADAWTLGGKYIGGSAYDGWVAGYATTASIDLGIYGTWGNGTVWANITAT
jgi:hypothetical protein